MPAGDSAASVCTLPPGGPGRVNAPVPTRAGLTAVHRRGRQARETMHPSCGIALADSNRMNLKRFLIVVWVAGCGGGGGGGNGGDGPGPGDPDAPANPTDAGPRNDATDANQNPIDGSVSAANDLCANATTISTAAMHAEVAATTTGAHAEFAAPCGSAGVPDVFFKFTLTRRELVYADTFGATASTALFFASSCTTARTAATTTDDALCSTGACGTGQSQVAALLGPGTHYLVLASQGAATIHFQHVEVGAGTVQPLAQGSSTPTGTTSGFGSLYACDGGGAENSYWWRTCPSNAGGTFQASTCTGTDFDTILSLQLPGSDLVMCDDDTDGCGQFQSRVTANMPAGAGLYVISVDGFSQAKHGNYTLTSSRP